MEKATNEIINEKELLSVIEQIKVYLETLGWKEMPGVEQSIDPIMVQIEKTKNSLDELANQINNEEINLVVFGSTSAGKTCVINKLINVLSEQGKGPETDILIEDEIENTVDTMILTKSPNSKIILEIPGKSPLSMINIEVLHDYLKELNEEYSEKISDIKQKKNHEIFKHSKLMLPFLIPKINLIDTAGLSSDSFFDSLKEILRNQLSILIYVKNLEDPEGINEKVYKLLNEWKIKNGYDKNWLLFTKEDRFVSKYEINEKKDHPLVIENKKEKKLVNFEKNLDKYEEDFGGIFHRSFFIRPDMFFSIDKEEKKKCRNVFNDLRKDFELTKYDFEKYRFAMIINNIDEIFSDFNTHLDGEHEINSKKMKQIEKICIKLCGETEKKIIDFFNYFIPLTEESERTNTHPLKKNEDLVFKTINKSAIQTSLKVKSKEISFVKPNFVKSVSQQMNKDIQNILLEKINDLTRELFNNLMNEIAKIIGKEKLSQILNMDLDFSGNELQSKISENVTNMMLAASSVSLGIVWIAQRTMIKAGELAAEALVAGLGWLVLGVSAFTTAYSFKNYIGWWSYENSRIDILNNIFKAIFLNREKFIASINGDIEILKNSILTKLEKAKHFCKQGEEIRKQIRTIKGKGGLNHINHKDDKCLYNENNLLELDDMDLIEVLKVHIGKNHLFD